VTRATIAAEALAAVLCVDVLVSADPTTTGTALLLATAVWCAVASAEVAMLTRGRAAQPRAAQA
jgi:hypothetical protein